VPVRINFEQYYLPDYRIDGFGDISSVIIQGESKKPDTFDIQKNNKGVSFF
jgi:hypothetical protein